MKIYHTIYFWRTFATYVLLLFIGIGLLGMHQLLSLSNSETSKDVGNLNAQVALLAKASEVPLQNADEPSLLQLGNIITQQTGFRVTIILPSGEVLVDTMEAVEVMNNHLSRPEVQLAIAREIGEVERFSRTLNKNFVYRALAVRDGSRLLGVVRVARAREDLDELIADRRHDVLITGLVVLLLLSSVVAVLVWRNTATVVLITQTTEAIAKGDFERRVPESRALGMKRMADAINQMARHSALRLANLTADRNRLATIFTGMVEGVVDVDQNQKIVRINEAAIALLGLENGKSVGKPVWQEIRNQKITQALDEALQSQSVIKTQVDFLRGREQLVIDLYVASLSDDEGKPIGGILVLHDVTELKRLERIRTDFVANASHELKTPITAIRGLSETVITDDEVDRATLLSFMERVHAQSIRLSQLVGDLMTISRLEADSGVASFSHINFTDLATRATIAAKPAAELKQQTLKVNLTSEKLEVYGDRQILSQLVDNLIDNAIKYTPEAGNIELRLRAENKELVFEVEDSGIGISPQFQERVFERFYRVDKARSQSLGGTGLGLSIVRNIAERHDGSVDVKSHLGKGSIFIFRMPLAVSDSEIS